MAPRTGYSHMLTRYARCAVEVSNSSPRLRSEFLFQTNQLVLIQPRPLGLNKPPSVAVFFIWLHRLHLIRAYFRDKEALV